MFNRPIETTVSIMGFVVYLKYFVTVQKAVEWCFNMDWYCDPTEDQMPGPGIDLLEACLRTHWSGFIETRLLDEFEARMYEEEEKLAAQAAMEDIIF